MPMMQFGTLNDAHGYNEGETALRRRRTHAPDLCLCRVWYHIDCMPSSCMLAQVAGVVMSENVYESVEAARYVDPYLVRRTPYLILLSMCKAVSGSSKAQQRIQRVCMRASRLRDTWTRTWYPTLHRAICP